MSGRIMSTQQRGRGRGGFGPRRAPEGNYSGNQRSYHTRYVTEVPEPNVHQCNCTDILDNFKSVLTAYSINRALDCCNFDLYHIKDDFAKTLFFGLSCSCCGLKRNFVPTTRLRTSSGIAITMDIIEYGNATRARNGEHISVELLDRVDCVLDCDSTAEEPGYLSIPKQLIAQNVPRLRVGFKPTPNELDQFTVFISPKPSFGVRNPPIQNREPQRSLPATSPRDNTTSTTFYALIPNRTDPNENSLPQSRTVTETYANKRVDKEKIERERAEQEKFEREKAERDKRERERVEREKEKENERQKEREREFERQKERDREQRDRERKEREERERKEKEDRERERKEREERERERKEKERAEKERLEKERKEKNFRDSRGRSAERRDRRSPRDSKEDGLHYGNYSAPNFYAPSFNRPYSSTHQDKWTQDSRIKTRDSSYLQEKVYIPAKNEENDRKRSPPANMSSPPKKKQKTDEPVEREYSKFSRRSRSRSSSPSDSQSTEPIVIENYIVAETEPITQVDESRINEPMVSIPFHETQADTQDIKRADPQKPPESPENHVPTVVPQEPTPTPKHVPEVIAEPMQEEKTVPETVYEPAMSSPVEHNSFKTSRRSTALKNSPPESQVDGENEELIEEEYEDKNEDLDIEFADSDGELELDMED